MYRLWVLGFVLIGVANSRAAIRSTNLAGVVEVDNGKFSIRNDGEYPYVAQIFDGKNFICAATIVGSKTVLTAGSCFKKIGRNTKVIAGTITNEITKTAQKVGIEQVIKHNCADLTLIITAKKFSYTKHVQKVKLATTNQRDKYIQKLVTIMGFHMANADYQSTLFWADVNLMSKDGCKSAIQGSKVSLKNKLCVIGSKKDVAIGTRDYGAPLVKFIDGKPYLLGIASQVTLVNKKPSTKHPTIYTDVTELENFIDNPKNQPTGCFGF